MKHALFSLPFLVSALLPADLLAAGSRDDLMEKIADVVALARTCPTLEMNTVFVTTIAMGQNIGKSNGDYDTIDAMANAREGMIRRGDTQIACETGRKQYGPGGAALPGLLREREGSVQ